MEQKFCNPRGNLESQKPRYIFYPLSPSSESSPTNPTRIAITQKITAT